MARAPYYLRDPLLDQGSEGVDPIEVLLRGSDGHAPEDQTDDDQTDPIVSGRVAARDPILEDGSSRGNTVKPSGGGPIRPAQAYPMPDTSQRDEMIRHRDALLKETPWPIPLMNQNRDKKLAQYNQAIAETDRFTNQDYGHRIQAFSATKPKVVGQPWFDPEGNMHYTVAGPDGDLTDQNMGAAYNRYDDNNKAKRDVAGTNAGARVGAAGIQAGARVQSAQIAADQRAKRPLRVGPGGAILDPSTGEVLGQADFKPMAVGASASVYDPNTGQMGPQAPPNPNSSPRNDPRVALRARAIASNIANLNRQLAGLPPGNVEGRQNLQIQIERATRAQNELLGAYGPPGGAPPGAGAPPPQAPPPTTSGPPPVATSAPAAPGALHQQVTPPAPTPQPIDMGGRKAKDGRGVLFYEQPNGKWLDPQGNEYK